MINQMVRKSITEGWKISTPLNTPSQINKFFDTCSEWILSESQKNDSVIIESVCRNLPVESDKSLGITEEEAVLIEDRKCFNCQEITNQVKVANPFCRAYSISLCSKCYDGM